MLCISKTGAANANSGRLVNFAAPTKMKLSSVNRRRARLASSWRRANGLAADHALAAYYLSGGTEISVRLYEACRHRDDDSAGIHTKSKRRHRWRGGCASWRRLALTGGEQQRQQPVCGSALPAAAGKNARVERAAGFFCAASPGKPRQCHQNLLRQCAGVTRK